MNGANTYYFMADGSPRNVRGLRVLRACDISTCSSPCNFNALYELRIDCGGGSLPWNSVICGLTVLDIVLLVPLIQLSCWQGVIQALVLAIVCAPFDLQTLIMRWTPSTQSVQGEMVMYRWHGIQLLGDSVHPNFK